MSDTDATQTRQTVAVDEVLDFLDYEVGNDDHIFYDTYSELHDMVSKLGYENAKLRELVKAMTPFLCCMPFASCNTLAASVRKRMSELGIEVVE